MSRWGIRTAVLALALALPPAAQATTYTIDAASGGCASSGTTCTSFGEASSKVQDGDTVNALPGTYAEGATVTFDKNNLTVTGAGLFATSLTGAGDFPTLAFTGNGSKLSGIAVVQTNASTAEAIKATGTLAITDALAFSTKGPAITFSGGTDAAPNTLTRVGAYATAASSDAVLFTSASTAPPTNTLQPNQKLVVDSSILSGGAAAAGLRVQSGAGTPFSNAGNLTVEARHLTAAGSAQAIVADASAANGAPGPVGAGAAGAIAVTATDSILSGAIEKKAFSGNGLTVSNTADVTTTNSDTSTDPAKLFVDAGARNFHERVDAPTIDKAGTPAAGESDKDIDGEPRVANGKSDLGADEFLNKAPTAALKADATSVRQQRPVNFDASGSADPEAAIGGGIGSYRWDFGDGTVITTAGPKTDHIYNAKGDYAVVVTVVDRQGGLAASPPVGVTVTDGVAPDTKIGSPIDGQVFGFGKPITFAGTATDDSGISKVNLLLRQTKRARAPRKKATRKAKKAAATKCKWFDGRRSFVSTGCFSPKVLKATVSDRNWSYKVPRTKKFKLPRGRYELYVQAVDRTGLANTIFTVPFKTLVHFRVK